MKPALLSAVIVVTAATSLSASAVPVLYSGTSGTHSATANFSVTQDSKLQVTLSNVSASDARVPTDILTGVFFNVIGNLALHPETAMTGGTTYKVGASGGGFVSGHNTSVGGEWAYRNNLNAYSANSGISSSGLGLFGPDDRFQGSNLSGPPSGSLADVKYGLAPAGDNQATGNGGLSGRELTRYSITFLLTGIASNFDPLASINSVTFQYGGSLSEPSVVGAQEGGSRPNAIPEPATMGLVSISLLALGVTRRRKVRLGKTRFGGFFC